MTGSNEKQEIIVDGCRIYVWRVKGKVIAKADECEARPFPISTPFEDAAVSYLIGA